MDEYVMIKFLKLIIFVISNENKLVSEIWAVCQSHF